MLPFKPNETSSDGAALFDFFFVIQRKSTEILVREQDVRHVTFCSAAMFGTFRPEASASLCRDWVVGFDANGVAEWQYFVSRYLVDIIDHNALSGAPRLALETVFDRAQILQQRHGIDQVDRRVLDLVRAFVLCCIFLESILAATVFYSEYSC